MREAGCWLPACSLKCKHSMPGWDDKRLPGAAAALARLQRRCVRLPGAMGKRRGDLKGWYSTLQGGGRAGGGLAHAKAGC